jgi:hypothetical protein
MPLMHARRLVSKKYMTSPREELSAQNGHLGIVKLLRIFEHGTDVHAMNDQSQTLYQASSQTGNRSRDCRVTLGVWRALRKVC